MPIVKLDKEDIKAIKELFEKTNLIDREIAKIFGVSRKHINAIRNKKRWNYEYGKETKDSQLQAISGYIQE